MTYNENRWGKLQPPLQAHCNTTSETPVIFSCIDCLQLGFSFVCQLRTSYCHHYGRSFVSPLDIGFELRTNSNFYGHNTRLRLSRKLSKSKLRDGIQLHSQTGNIVLTKIIHGGENCKWYGSNSKCPSAHDV